MNKKGLSRVVLPLLTVLVWDVLTIYLQYFICRFSFFPRIIILFPLIMISLVAAVTISFFITNLFPKDFFDFKPLETSSYNFLGYGLKNRWADFKNGKPFRIIMNSFVIGFLIISVGSWFLMESAYEKFHLRNWGKITKAVVSNYEVHRSKGNEIAERIITVRYTSSDGNEQLSYISVKNSYLPGDSVLIKYSSKRPVITELVKTP